MLTFDGAVNFCQILTSKQTVTVKLFFNSVVIINSMDNKLNSFIINFNFFVINGL